ncbi:hypothetical protein LN040_08195 [Desulfovibrio subterraneus]|uniref:hypothetical protein n=1 Tax=Desulfovibrio subterraneus TaxID=2718620 RepID=UPI0022B8A30F|nr:hypothetical protein [Desulfovibrio subterraneus]WBF69054.1 hypothetical protein LN040_08195 [Desulfovibrio subterraneus]
MLFPLTIDLPHGTAPDASHPLYDATVTTRGLCPRCGREHTLPAGVARAECASLMRLLEQHGRIDMQAPDHAADPHFSLEYLHGVARGQMFGVLVVRTQNGGYGTLRAFSAQYNRVWHVAGWVPPLIDIAAFDAQVAKDDPVINALGRRIRQLDATIAAERDAAEQTPQAISDTTAPVVTADTGPMSVDEAPAPTRIDLLMRERAALVDERKGLSQRSMRAIHELYRVHSFGNRTDRADRAASLFEIFPAGRGVPTGTGDCCAPKLLQYAILHNMTPLGLAEFYWGRESRSGARRHGEFYPSCQDKCYPILGYMLCGLEERAVTG